MPKGCSLFASIAAARRQHPVGIALEGSHGCNRRPAKRQRAGLVESDDADLARPLQRFDIADQDAGPGSRTGSGDERGRRRQPERARAGDDEHRDSRCKPARGIAERKPPDKESRGGHDEDDRHEDRRNAIDQPLDGCVASLRLLDQPRHAGEPGVGADLGDCDFESSLAVDGSSQHRIAFAALDRQTFARHQRFIDRGAAGEDHPIARETSAGSHQHDVALAQRSGRYGSCAVGRYQFGFRRLKLAESGQRSTGTAFGARLEIFAEHDKRQHDGRRLEIEMRVGVAADHFGERSEKGDGGAERNQHGHVGPAAAHGVERLAVETRAGREHDAGGQSSLRPRADPGVAGAHHHRQRAGNQDERQQRRDRETQQRLAFLGQSRGLALFVRLALARFVRAAQRCAITRLLDGFDQFFGRDLALDLNVGALQRKVDFGVLYAVDARQRLGNARGAGSAGHA